MNETTRRRGGFDGAAVTRSLLGWGVVAGIFYLITGITLGLTRDGFDFGKHALSHLMLGDFGWAQTANLILSGLMTVAAAAGARRAMRDSRGATGLLVGAYGLCLVASAIFPPDPMAGFPEGATSNEPSVSGLAHLTFGAIGFLTLSAAAFVAAGWFARRGQSGLARYSRTSGIVVAVGFVAGAAFSAGTFGVVCLWVTVVTGWAWLAVASLGLYRTVPIPDACRRSGSTTTDAPAPIA